MVLSLYILALHCLCSGVNQNVNTAQSHATTPRSARTRPHLGQPLLRIARSPNPRNVQQHDLGPMSIGCSYCGAKHWLDERVNRSTTHPEFGMCCAHGKVRLPLLPDPPAAIRDLYTAQTPRAKEFRENIRQYNAALAFTSVKASTDDAINHASANSDRPRPWVYRIHGVIYHSAGPLEPEPGRRRAYAQLYVYDPRAALDDRMVRNDNLSRDTMALLQNTLLQSNHYARVYQHAQQVFEHYNGVDITLRLVVHERLDRRRYNLPTSDDIAVILPGDDTTARDKREIVLHRRNGTLTSIHDGHPAYAPLHYVLLFPLGTPGWHWSLKLYEPERPNPRRLTQRMYYAYELFVRDCEFSTILRGARLFQQYAVDMWVATESNRLSWLHFHQDEIRACLYSGLEDAMRREDQAVDLRELGQRIVLPSSYTGGPRHMYQLLQDAMALGRYYKKIDLFITMTANPKWPEITRELFPGQTAADRPDLVARVFHLKMKQLIREIFVDGILGRTVAYVFTIEFQKRGLPHMHLLIFFEQDDKQQAHDARRRG